MINDAIDLFYDWSFPAIIVLSLGLFLAMGAYSKRQSARRMNLAIANTCGLCDEPMAQEQGVCPACNWDPALLQSPTVRRTCEAYQALHRALDDCRTAQEHHAMAQRLSGHSSVGDASAADQEEAGFRAEIDAMDAVAQALLSVPEFRSQVTGITDPFEAAVRLLPELKRVLERATFAT